jgi:hypothetical protein
LTSEGEQLYNLNQLLAGVILQSIRTDKKIYEGDIKGFILSSLAAI